MTTSRERPLGVGTLTTIGEGITLFDKYDTEQTSPVNEQTGLFLQQFTNSVSHALYKERCAFNVSDDDAQFSRRQGLFAIGNNENLQSKHYANFLPSIDTLTYLHEQLFTKQKEPPTIKTPHSSFRGDRMAEIPTSQTRLSHARLLSKSLNNLKDSSTEDLRLPKIMNIRDVKGNLWEISEHRPSTRMRTVRLSQTPETHFEAIKHTGELTTEEPNVSKNYTTSDKQQHAINTEKILNSPKHQSTKADMHSRTGGADKQSIPKRLSQVSNQTPDETLEPSCSVAPSHPAMFLPCTNSSNLVYHDEFERKSLLKKINADTRARKLTYNDYIQKLSEVKYCSCQKETPQAPDMSTDKRRRLSIRKSSDASANSYDERSESEHRAIYTRQGTSLFPPELEELYTRSNLTVLTMNDRSPLPKNFLEQEKESVRSFYPMCDWGFQKEKEPSSSSRPCSKRIKLRSRGSLRSRLSVRTLEHDNDLKLSGIKMEKINMVHQRSLIKDGTYPKNSLSKTLVPIHESAPEVLVTQDDNLQSGSSKRPAAVDHLLHDEQTEMKDQIFEMTELKSDKMNPSIVPTLQRTTSKQNMKYNENTKESSFTNARKDPAIQILAIPNPYGSGYAKDTTLGVPKFSKEESCKCGVAHDHKNVATLKTKDVIFQRPKLLLY